MNIEEEIGPITIARLRWKLVIANQKFIHSRTFFRRPPCRGRGKSFLTNQPQLGARCCCGRVRLTVKVYHTARHPESSSSRNWFARHDAYRGHSHAHIGGSTPVAIRPQPWGRAVYFIEHHNRTPPKKRCTEFRDLPLSACADLSTSLKRNTLRKLVRNHMSWHFRTLQPCENSARRNKRSWEGTRKKTLGRGREHGNLHLIFVVWFSLSARRPAIRRSPGGDPYTQTGPGPKGKIMANTWINLFRSFSKSLGLRAKKAEQ